MGCEGELMGPEVVFCLMSCLEGNLSALNLNSYDNYSGNALIKGINDFGIG